MVMQTVQIRLTEKQIKAIDGTIRKGIYPNRSEAVRNVVSAILMVAPSRKQRKRGKKKARAKRRK